MCALSHHRKKVCVCSLHSCVCVILKRGSLSMYQFVFLYNYTDFFDLDCSRFHLTLRMDHRNLVALVILVVAAISSLDAYKLNVPKVLLPFHSSKLISFVLEVKTEQGAGDQSGSSTGSEELCFDWSTSRPDIVTITPLYDTSSTKCSPQDDTSSHSLYGDGSETNTGGRNECSRKAIVTAVSKHAQRLTSIILAKETSKI